MLDHSYASPSPHRGANRGIARRVEEHRMFSTVGNTLIDTLLCVVYCIWNIPRNTPGARISALFRATLQASPLVLSHQGSTVMKTTKTQSNLYKTNPTVPTTFSHGSVPTEFICSEYRSKRVKACKQPHSSRPSREVSRDDHPIPYTQGFTTVWGWKFFNVLY